MQPAILEQSSISVLRHIPSYARWFIWGALTIFITAVSLAPSKTFEDVPSFSYEDLLVHFCLYFGYTASLLFALLPHHKDIKLTIITAAAFSIAYGIGIEILQPIVQPNDRTFSILDILANSTGAVGISLYIFIHRHKD